MVTKSERTIFINQNLDMVISGNICSQIMELSYLEKTPIYLMINSLGGNIQSLRNIIAAMNASGCKIITYVIGLAASSAAILFLQGKERYMLEGSKLLFHEPVRNRVKNISYSELKELMKVAEEEYTFFVDEMDKKCHLYKEQIQSFIYKNEWLIGASEAVALGFATEVITKF